MKARVAGLAQRHKIPVIVCAAVGQLAFVVYSRGRGQLALAVTQLTHGMFFDKRRAYPFPCPTVTLVGFGIALVLVIPLRFLLGVFVAIPVRRQLGTAVVSARFRRFVRHGLTSAIKKAATVLPVTAL